MPKQKMSIMKKQDWMDLTRDCPLSTEECRSYFLQQYLEAWNHFQVNRDILVEFLRAKGFDLEVKRRQRDWHFFLWHEGELVAANSAYRNRELAYVSAIKEAFHELES